MWRTCTYINSNYITTLRGMHLHKVIGLLAIYRPQASIEKLEKSQEWLFKIFLMATIAKKKSIYYNTHCIQIKRSQLYIYYVSVFRNWQFTINDKKEVIIRILHRNHCIRTGISINLISNASKKHLLHVSFAFWF